MTDWLSETPESTTGDTSIEKERPLRPVSEPQADDWLSEDNAAPATPVAPEPTDELREKVNKQSRALLIGYGIVLGASILGAVAVGVMKPGQDKDPEPEAEQAAAVTSTQQPTTSQATAEVAAGIEKFAGVCGGKNPVVAPGQHSLEASISAFQKAYFAQDAKTITSLVADSSGLKKQNWKKVFSSLDKDSTYCVTMTPGGSDKKVDADLVVHAKGKNTVYHQTVSGEKTKGKWVITSIDKRTDGKAEK